MVLIYILIILFVILVTYQVIVSFSTTTNLIEGLENEGTTSTSTQEYKPYNLNDPNNSLILSQQNAGNIEVLRGIIDKFDGVKEKLDTMNLYIMEREEQILLRKNIDYLNRKINEINKL
jgi:hypothetical protein